MKLFMVRHGQTTGNVAGLIYGQMDYPLTQKGRDQAMAIQPVLRKISFDRVYSSDLSRAIETQQLAVPDAQGIRTPLLREFDVGRLTNITYEEAEEKYAAELERARTEGYDWFGGESYDQILERLRKFLAVLEADPCENVIAFTHNGILGFMLQLVLGAQFSRTAVKSANCAIQVFEFDGSSWKLLAWNYMTEIN